MKNGVAKGVASEVNDFNVEYAVEWKINSTPLWSWLCSSNPLPGINFINQKWHDVSQIASDPNLAAACSATV